MGTSSILKAIAQGTMDACEQINKETIARVEEAEATLLHAQGIYTLYRSTQAGTKEHEAYRAKLDEIHATALRLMGRK